MSSIEGTPLADKIIACPAVLMPRDTIDLIFKLLLF